MDNSIHFDSFVQAKYTQLHPKVQAWWSVAKGKLTTAKKEIAHAFSTARRDPDVRRVLEVFDRVYAVIELGVEYVKEKYMTYVHPYGRYCLLALLVIFDYDHYYHYFKTHF